MRCQILGVIGIACLLSVPIVACGGDDSSGDDTATGGTGGTSAASGGTSTASGGTSTASGGTSTASGGTSTASGGTTFVSTAAVADACTDYCAALVAQTGCTTLPTQAECETSCAVGASLLGSCATQMASYYTCGAAEPSSSWECDAETGEPVLSDAACATESAAILTCMMGGGGATVEGCDAYCETIVATDCDGTPTAEECDFECSMMGEVPAECTSELTSFLECLGGVTYTCDEDGEPTPANTNDCEAEVAALGTCAEG